MQNGLFYEPNRKGRGVHLVNVGDMYTAAPISIETLDLFDATTSQIQNFRAQEGDLFFTRSSVVPSGIAYCNILPDCKEADVVFDSHVIRVRANPNIMDARFLYLNCLGVHSRKYLVSSAKTATMTTIDQGALKRCPVLVPPLPEQRAIATALSDVDALLDGLDRLIAKKRDLKQAAMQQLLTGKTRLPGFKGEWEVKRLGDMGGFLKGSGVRKDEAQSGDLPCIRYGEIYTHHNDYVLSYNSWISSSVASTAVRLKKGDILFAGSGETKDEIGKCVAFIDDREAYAGGDIVILRPHEADPIFMGYYCNTTPVRKQKASRGQGDAVVHISATALSSVEVKVPSLPEQTAIATILSDMDAELAALEQRRNKTKDIKQAMMQELLTGKTRLT
nr:restriction endonuclease subunit S [Desulforhopalus vacuolatus]